MLACGALQAETGPASPAEAMADTRRQAMVAVIEQAIALGFPDAKGGKLFLGKLGIIWSDSRPGSGIPAKRQQYDGLHLRTVDGSWVVNLQWSLAGADDHVTVDASGLREVSSEQLVELVDAMEAMEWHPMKAIDDEAWKRIFHDGLPPLPDAGSSRRAILMRWHGGGVEMGAPIAHLVRLGIPCIEQLSSGISPKGLGGDASARRFWEAAPSLLHIAGPAVGPAARYERTWGPLPPGVPLGAATLRRLLAAHFTFRLMNRLPDPFPEQPLGRRVAAALAMLDPLDPATPFMQSEIGKLRARAGLQADVGAGADMASRLASLGGYPVMWGMPPDREGLTDENIMRYSDVYGRMNDAGLAQKPDWFQAAIAAHRAEVRFTENDLDALVALAGDSRPSLWLDEGRCRTVGDNALRAIANVLLGCDPRSFLGRDRMATWDDAERAATAAALATWWRDHRGQPFPALVASVLAHAPLSDLSHHIERCDRTQRDRIFTLLASLWLDKPPKVPHPWELARILEAGLDHAALRRTVAAWPVGGDLEMLLIAWHLRHGNGKPFDDLLARELGSEPTRGPAPSAREMIAEACPPGFVPRLEALARYFPAVDRLRMVVAHVSKPIAAPGVLSWINALSGGWSIDSDATWILLRGQQWTNEQKRGGGVMQLAVFGTLLQDQRPVPSDLLPHCEPISKAVLPQGASIAPDLRACDIAAVILKDSQVIDSYFRYGLFREDLAKTLSDFKFNVSDNVETRNRVIREMRHLVAEAMPPALKAAGLPLSLRSITDVPEAVEDVKDF